MVIGRQELVLNAAKQTNLSTYAQTGDLPFQIFLLRAVSYDEQLVSVVPAEMRGKKLHQHVDAFFLAQTAHKTHGRIPVTDAQLCPDGGNVVARDVFGHKVGKIHCIWDNIDVPLYAAPAQELHYLQRRADDLSGLVGHFAEINMSGRLDHVLEPFRRDIEHVIVIHRVQCVDDGLFQLARGKLRKDTHAELGVDMNDVRVKILNDAQALDVDRVGQSIPVNAFEGDGGAVQNTILNIMAYGLGAGGDDEHLMPCVLQALLQRLDMRHDAADEGEVGLCKNSYLHK